MRASLLALLLALPATMSTSDAVYDSAGPIVATPIPLDRDAPNRRRVGRLTFLAGWRLSSPNEGFGGLSSMVADDTGNFLAVADVGTAFRFRMGQAGIVGRSSIRDLPGAEGSDKGANDTESVTTDPVTGAIWIGYEGRNMIRRFDPGLRYVEAEVKPALMHDWPNNTGAEAMTRLRDGRFVVLAEKADRGAGTTAGILFSGDPTLRRTIAMPFRYRPPGPGFRPTDSRQLPDGRLLVLHRRFTALDGFSAALAIVDPRAMRRGATVAGAEVARFAWPLTIDNMEALAITRERGRTILWIASDDNFLVLQQTLLLKFALDPGV